ncbi:hypothetical protein [Streptomyces sp. NBC_01102]|uniref:hypothetical protein n=1 Tax=Streptomyces sp. NBC_01102 TaxID=2903749 RepID=UPI00386CA0F9
MSAPTVIHRPSPTGGRRVTIRGRIAGLAFEDQDVTELLPRAGGYPARPGRAARPYARRWREDVGAGGRRRPGRIRRA